MHRLASALLLMMSLASLLSLVPGCYQLDTTPGKFRCGQPGDECPGSQECIDGLCREPDDTTGIAVPDMAAIQPPPVPSGCSGTGGTRLAEAGTAQLHACPGRFDQGQAASLCRAGYHLCGAQDEALLLALAGSGRCDRLSGFFAAQVEAALNNDDLLCIAATGGQRAVLLGCGEEPAGVQSSTTLHTRTSCRQLSTALPCDALDAWTCTTRLADAGHSDASGGVLCCSGD